VDVDVDLTVNDEGAYWNLEDLDVSSVIKYHSDYPKKIPQILDLVALDDDVELQAFTDPL